MIVGPVLCLFILISKAPSQPIVKESLDTSMVIGFTKLPPENSHAYSYVVTATSSAGKAHESNCNVETLTCELTGLTAARAYEVTVSACFFILPNEAVCSLQSQSQTTWTRPKGTFYN